MKFNWDEIKNRKNFKKHGVWFEEASTVFADINALEIFDVDHSDEEDRYILLGRSTLPRLLIVVYSEHAMERIRIISAREASGNEARDYEKRI